MTEKSLRIRAQDELLRKFKYVASYDGRSMNSQIVVYMRQCVEKFEKEHGPIPLEEKKNS